VAHCSVVKFGVACFQISQQMIALFFLKKQDICVLDLLLREVQHEILICMLHAFDVDLQSHKWCTRHMTAPKHAVWPCHQCGL